jgi:hypothetical protein
MHRCTVVDDAPAGRRWLAGTLPRLDEASPAGVAALLLALFVLVHALYFRAGIRVIDTLDRYMQHLEPRLLGESLGESLWYLHGQPPLFNLLLGLIVKISPVYRARLYLGVALVAGLALYLATYRCLRDLSVPRALSAALVVAFMAAPSFVLYETLMFYALPVAALLAVSVVALAWFLRTGGSGPIVLFFLVLLLLCGTWALFHLGYFAATAAGLALACGGQRRRVLLAAAVPFLLLLALYTKNFVLFGHFSASTWFGMNLAKMTDTLRTRPDSVLRGWPSILLVRPFSPLSAYRPYLGPDPRPPDRFIPALHAETFGGRRINFNHVAYIRVADRYVEEEKRLLRRQPAALLSAYLESVADSWLTYFESSSDYSADGQFFLEPNRGRIRRWTELVDRLAYGRLPVRVRGHSVYVVLLLAAIAAGLCPVLVRGRPRLSREDRILVAYVWGNIVFVAVVGNLVETGENNRFRFATDALSLVLLGLAWHRLTGSPRPATPAGPWPPRLTSLTATSRGRSRRRPGS